MNLTTNSKKYDMTKYEQSSIHLFNQFFLFPEHKPKMALSKAKVCLIGAGPSGMSVMFHMNRLAQQGVQVPEIKCYEKQSNWGGLWNYSWRTGKCSL